MDEPGFQPFKTREEVRDYEEDLLRRDFRSSPDLRRYFGRNFFNDGKFERFDYDPNRNRLVLEMESVLTLNDVYDLRAAAGMKREMPHRCVDFQYICEFESVVLLHVQLHPMLIGSAHTDEQRMQILLNGLNDDYQSGRILFSDLCAELSTQAGIPLFHLQFRTGWNKLVDVVFRRVTVRKSNDVTYESYTEGIPVHPSYLLHPLRSGRRRLGRESA